MNEGNGAGSMPADPRAIYETMATISVGEAATVGAVRAGRLNAAVYPVRGLEGVCAALGDVLEPTDYLVSTYRNLGDAVAKGVELRRVIAESYGRKLGTSKGKGGPMHLVDVHAGLMATSGIVGGGVPIAVGLALAAQLDGEGQIAATTFGDGATSIGAYHEAMNLAALWNLPIVFVCQNNQWGEHTALVDYAGNPDLSERARSYGMHSVAVDGFDVPATWRALRDAADHARSGAGPAFVEAITYRLGPHSAASDRGYMPKQDFDAAMERDPTPAFRKQLLESGTATAGELDRIDARVHTLVEDAMQAAIDSPPQTDDELFTDVFADPAAIPATKWKARA
ncbi:thiamine pyrophosphate-dependent dehydrogenase E1 component subunit alpha [Amycolatopsis alkalitolerans]|uniref:Thiamine pyrophosphate-dependent dehydrogenase E1 component subunit alpha n=1 Tax=Amycolatopsis alkalitolerans TaxID=2547244 RepID=A0A5C4MBD5_9PSEU|nr:thiamine pyrophosphate-dependent dehydrogenase E1 component subunit alpha [Amycolatopsis alkalitolerans]TNC29220.1 thiamine pyrophosphate-dependent dehydrogenase E1 component subunit alpha [Amycolatopsis alkalitolerans]